MGGQRLEDLAGVRAGRHQVPEVHVGVGVAGGVVEVRQAQVVPELVGEDADAGVLRLHDVVRHLQVGARDRVATGHRRGVRPHRVDADVAATAGLALVGVHQHQVVDHTVRLVVVAVAVAVALVLDVVVGPREVRVGRGQRVDRVGGETPGALRVVRVAVHRLLTPGDPVAVLVLEAARGGVPALRVRHRDPRAGLPVHGVRALGHLQVHVVHGPPGEADARLAVRPLQVLADPLGDALLAVQHLVVVGRREVRHPHRVVVLVRQRGRVRDRVVPRPVLHGAGNAGAVLEHRLRDHHACEVVVGLVVELDEQRQQLGGLRALGLLDLARALAGPDGLGLQLGQLARRDRVTPGVLAVVGAGLVRR